MNDWLPLSIGIGLTVGLLFGEAFGLAAGGLIVPGYLALYLAHPLDVVLTLLAAFATFGILRAASAVTIVVGRRRTALTILVGFLVGYGMRWAAVRGQLAGYDADVVGFIIPGLLALWMERQGAVETVTATLTMSAVVRLVLIAAAGMGSQP